MGTATLTSIGTGSPVDATGDQLDQYKAALGGDVVPRNTSGVATDQGGNLGSSTYQWYNLYVKNSIIQDGSILDFSNLTGNLYQIVSGEAQSDGYPTYMTVISSTAGAYLDTQTTDFSFIANGTSKTITSTSSVTFTGLTLATSSTANQCLVNDTAYSGSLTFTKTEGEHGAFITIDTEGASVTALDQSIQVFKNTTSGEFFLTFLDTTNHKLTPIKRGIGTTSRGAMNNNEILALMKTAYLFLNVDGSTTYTTYNYPKYTDSAPSGPTSGDWYFDFTAHVWYRYSGSAWVAINAHFVGFAWCDFGACAGVEPMDFDKAWKTDLQCQIEYLSASKTRIKMCKINVAGINIEFPLGREIDLDLSASGDRESGVSEAASTLYYIYCDKNFKLRYSDVCPRPKDKRHGYYHPKYYWRCIGTVWNNAGSNLAQFIHSENSYNYFINGTGGADSDNFTTPPAGVTGTLTTSYLTYEIKSIPPFAVMFNANIFWGVTGESSGFSYLYLRFRGNTYSNYGVGFTTGSSSIDSANSAFQNISLQNSTISAREARDLVNHINIAPIGYAVKF
jgi:hypothetical protein